MRDAEATFPVNAVAPQRVVDLHGGVRRAIRAARTHLLSLQRPDGHWCGRLEADTVLESEFLLLMRFLGREDEARNARAAASIRRRQLPEGGWAIYPGGTAEVSASVKAYFVLKLQGDPAEAEHMRRARRAILDLGGLEAVNTYTKVYLAVFGQVPWDACPAIPPEMVLLPPWFPVELNDMSSWSRGIFVPLSVVWAHRPVRPVPPAAAIPELRASRPNGGQGEPPRLQDPGVRLWRAVFAGTDAGLKLLDEAGLRPLRRRALRAAERWILDRQPHTDGLGAIFPAIVNAVMALRCLGYPAEHPTVRHELEGLEKLVVDDGETLRLQPTLSPVWDTAQSLNALLASGLSPDHPALLRGAAWLLEREVRRPGDWRARNPRGGIGGWYFEYANEFYPDCDDTAEVLKALAGVRPADPELQERVRAARRRGLAWLASMQNDDGGWAAFDRNCALEPLAHVPFADHNAMLDPSWEDVTSRVLETLALEGHDLRVPIVRRGVDFLLSRQEEDGTWYGRWGCNYIYGTWLALQGLRGVGVDLREERFRRSVTWLCERQNADGGWGETLASYEDPRLKGRGRSTASQTAWAVLGLVAAGEADSEVALGGVEHLLRTRRLDGSWQDAAWTGTGFPGVFYLRYHLYDDYFPLLALASWRQASSAGSEGGGGFGCDAMRPTG